MKKSLANKIIVPMAVIVLISAFLVSWAFSALQVRGRGIDARRSAQEAEANLLDTLALGHGQLVSRLAYQMRVLQSEARRLGPARLGPGPAPDLRFGPVSPGRFLDQAETGGATVSIFGRRGSALVRLATSGHRQEAEHAPDPAGQAMARGEACWGITALSGERHYGYFEPIRDARGVPIGAFAVEYPLAGFLRLFQSLQQIRILEHGFLALVDRDGRPVFSASPLTPGATRELFQTGKLAGAAWAVRRRAFEPWGVLVLTAYPVREVEEVAWPIRAGAMAVALALVGSLTLSYFYVLRKNLLGPLGDVLGVLDMVTFFKQYELRFRQDQEGEVGILTRSLNNMLEQIQTRDARLLDYQEHLEDLVAQRLEQLLQTQQLLSATLDALPVEIAILDGAGVVLLTNRKWTQAAGGGNPLLAAAGVGSDYPALCRAMDPGLAGLQAVALRVVDIILGPPDMLRLDYDLELDQRWQGFTLLATRFDTQGTARTVLVNRNVTEQKQLETQLRQAQKLESIGQLAAGIAHEINTPTQYIGDNAVFLRQAFQDLWALVEPLQRMLAGIRDDRCPPELVRAARAAMDQADLGFFADEIPTAIDESLEGIRRISRIVGAMKDFSHPGASSKTLTDLNRAVESTTLVCRSAWKYVAELELDLAPDLPPVPCFPDEINQVILNLVINAAQAIGEAQRTRPGGKGLIRISTRPVDGFAQIRVEDSGCGIPEANRLRIFDPFFTTKPVGQGTGQGLAIAYAVVTEQHGGSIAMDSEVGKGTSFTLRLPYAGPPADGKGRNPGSMVQEVP
ncbi:MAG: ATP-binding protein [Holophaga sp.]|nr:ATP-binding protein [Holophaga sp.]